MNYLRTIDLENLVLAAGHGDLVTIDRESFDELVRAYRPLALVNDREQSR